jgi:hypothetical protein
VSRLPRTIDALVTLATEGERQRICAETPFFYFLKRNQVEFKGREDPLTIAGTHLIGGRTQLYLGEQDVSLQEMTVTVICAGKPRTVLAYAQAFQPFRRIEAGYYKNEAHPPVYLIVINELPLVPKNYALLLFASSEHKFRQFLDKVIIEGNTRYIRYAYEVRPQVTREVLTMAGISTTISRKDLEFMAEDIGPELVAIMSPEEVVASLEPEKQKKLLTLLTRRLNAKERKLLLDLLLKQQDADSEEHNGNGKNR